MKLRLDVEMNDGTQWTVDTNLFTVVAWERKFKRKISDLGSGIGAEDLAYLAWEAAKQNEIVVPMMFDDFIKKAKSVTVASEATVRPTREAPGDEA